MCYSSEPIFCHSVCCGSLSPLQHTSYILHLASYVTSYTHYTPTLYLAAHMVCPASHTLHATWHYIHLAHLTFTVSWLMPPRTPQLTSYILTHLTIPTSPYLTSYVPADFTHLTSGLVHNKGYSIFQTCRSKSFEREHAPSLIYKLPLFSLFNLYGIAPCIPSASFEKLS